MPGTDHAAALTKGFPPVTLKRLRRVKSVYDPENVFPISATTA
ncbi:BBE domain-containing protein [Streptomyces sp. NPDC057375]